MWRRMFDTYSLGPIPSGDEIREAVLADRLRFEAKLAEGAAGVAENRFATLTYEALIADPGRSARAKVFTSVWTLAILRPCVRLSPLKRNAAAIIARVLNHQPEYGATG